MLSLLEEDDFSIRRFRGITFQLIKINRIMTRPSHHETVLINCCIIHSSSPREQRQRRNLAIFEFIALSNVTISMKKCSSSPQNCQE